MHQKLNQTIDSILTEYTKEDNLDVLLEAKKNYFELTGVLHDDDEDYESKMARFNNWYIFQYTSASRKVPAVTEYFAKHTEDQELADALQNSSYSLFEFSKTNFRKHLVLKDLIRKEKVILAKDHPHIGIIEGDVFSGRIVNYGEKNYLLTSLCLFPLEVKSILAKHAKKIGKLKNQEEELNFLLKCESLKTKSTRYAHIDLDKIYVFGTN